MNKLIVLFGAALLLCLPCAALAGDAPGGEMTGATLCGLSLPDTCSFDCVSLCITCGYCCEAGGSKDGIMVEFLGRDTTVLGTATLAGPWCECGCETEQWGQLDKAVDPCDVRYVKITKPGEDDLCLSCFELNVGWWNDCKCKEKWHRAFDCCLPLTLGQGAGADNAIVLM